ncbi:MAG: group 1 truncated hemoglobin [Pseudomonadales bacterium]|nr:group 1 truncated hemoglobin [Pseudomonadales bacterium]
MSLYDDLGGEAAVDAAVDIFYQKVLQDERIKEFFTGVNMERQRKMQKQFLTLAFGGPNNYTGANMRKAHERAASYGLNDGHFDAVVENLASTLQGLGVTADKINEVAAVAESIRNDVLNKPQSAAG